MKRTRRKFDLDLKRQIAEDVYFNKDYTLAKKHKVSRPLAQRWAKGLFIQDELKSPEPNITHEVNYLYDHLTTHDDTVIETLKKLPNTRITEVLFEELVVRPMYLKMLELLPEFERKALLV